MDRFVLIWADCHVVGRPEDFRPFIAPQHLDSFDEENRKRIELARESRKASEEGGLLFSKKALEEYHSHDETAHDVMGGTSGQWDSDKRVKELEDDGVFAEVVFPNGGPFVTGRGGAPVPRELRTAGVLAYNRWLADFCAQTPGRRAGIAQLPIHDVDLAISEIELAAGKGLKGVSIPLLFDDPAVCNSCSPRAPATGCRRWCVPRLPLRVERLRAHPYRAPHPAE